MRAWAALREELRDREGLVDQDVLGFCWITDFPLVTWNADEERWDPSHHLFTAPVEEGHPPAGG